MFDISAEGLRIIANTEQLYDALLVVEREYRQMPEWMTWSSRNGRDYLYIKYREHAVQKSSGVRSSKTEAIFNEYGNRKKTLDERRKATAKSLAEYLRLYRALHLPQIPALPAKILRELDIRNHLGTNLIVVGTNAFAAYEIEARERFAHGLDETNDFDLGWCRGSKIAFADKTLGKLSGSPLLDAIKAVDKTFEINSAKPYQALNKQGYEVELLTAPSVMSSLSPEEAFSTAAIPEQEWLLWGRPVRHVVCANDGSPAPLIVPDPRWMGLHKLWLSKKETRRADKKDKDEKQGKLLLSAIAKKMQSGYPMDSDFLLEVPDELLPYFDKWAKEANYIPAADSATEWF